MKRVLNFGKDYDASKLPYTAEVCAGLEKEEARKTRRIKIRSLLTCKTNHGACIKCYGSNLATAGPVTVGEAVGIIAALLYQDNQKTGQSDNHPPD